MLKRVKTDLNLAFVILMALSISSQAGLASSSAHNPGASAAPREADPPADSVQSATTAGASNANAAGLSRGENILNDASNSGNDKSNSELGKATVVTAATTTATSTTTTTSTATATSAWATPQPALCKLLSGCLEQNQPWLAGADVGSDQAVSGIRATVSYSIPSLSVIQSDNELGAGVVAHAPSKYPEACHPIPWACVGRDYEFFGFVNVKGDGTISFVSSNWINCEWNNCGAWSDSTGCFFLGCTPFPFDNTQSCFTGQNNWMTCHDSGHWQMFVDRFVCNECGIGDKYVVEMLWVQNSYVLWNYYRNGALWHQATYTPLSGMLMATAFKTGSGQTPTNPRWYHFQFGVTSLYAPLGSGPCCWQVNIENPQYRNPADSKWYLISHTQAFNGGAAYVDNIFALGGVLLYAGLTVTGSSSDCYTRASFVYTGSNTNNAQDLWTGASCSTGGDPGFFNNAQFVSQSGPPSTVYPGQTVAVSVTTKNTGTTTWISAGPFPYRLGSQNPQDNNIWGTGRINLPSSVAPGNSITLSWTITAPSVPGTYAFQWKMVQELREWFGDLTPSLPVTVIDFALSYGSSYVIVQAGTSTSSTITLNSINGFAGTVALSASVSPVVANSPNATMNPTSVALSAGGSSTSTLTLSASSNTPPGYFSLIITGTSAGLSHSLLLLLVVTPPVSYLSATFTGDGGASGRQITVLASTPVSVTLSVWSTATVSGTLYVEVRRDIVFGFDNTFQWLAQPVTVVPGTNIISMGSFTPTDLTSTCIGCVREYFIRVYWNNFLIYDPNGFFAPDTREWVKTASSDFAISGSPTSLTLVRGASGPSTITLTSQAGFSGTVTLLAIPSGGVGVVSLASATLTAGGTTSFTVTILSYASTPLGTYTVTVTGTSGVLVRSVTLNVYVVDFSLSSPTTSLVIQAGMPGTATITVSSLNGFAGTVTLTATVSPALTNAPTTSLSSASVAVSSGGTASFSVTFSATTSTPAGNYVITINGASGSVSHVATLTVAVQDFGIPADPGYITLPAGSSGASVVTLTSLNGFAGTINLASFVSNATVTGRPSALLSTGIATLAAYGTTNITLTMVTTASTPAGNYTITVTGTSGSISRSVTVKVRVMDFSVSVSPSSLSLTLATSSATPTVTVTSLGGFSSAVSLGFSTSPSGPVVSLWPPSVTPSPGGSATSTLDISTGGATSGTYTITVTGTSGSLVHAASVTVTMSGDFSISSNPISLTVLRGTSGTSTITLTSLNGFSGTVMLASSASVSISAVSIDDPWCRSFGLLIDQQLNYPDFWNSQPSSVIGVGCSSFTYSNTYTLSSGSHFLEFGVSAWVGHWHVQITVNGVLMADVDTAVFSHVHVPFQVGVLSVSPLVTNGPVGSLNTTRTTLSAGGSVTITLTVTASSLTPLQSYVFTLISSSGGLSHSTTVTVRVADFGITVNPISVSFLSGGSGSTTATLTSLGGFSGTVNLSTSTSPSTGLTGSCPSGVTLTSGGTANANCTFSSSMSGVYSVSITGSSGPVSHTATATVYVQDFGITASPAALSISRGSSGSSTLNVTSLFGFSGNITLTATVSPIVNHGPLAEIWNTPSCPATNFMPFNQGCVVVPSGGWATATLTVFTASSTPRGTYSVTVTATISTITRYVTVTVTVG